MGISSCKQLLWIATGLKAHDLHMLRDKVFPDQSSEPYRIDIDVYNVVRTRYRKLKYNEMIIEFCDFCKTIAYSGFLVTLVLDGVKRHHSKRATQKRKAKKEFALVNSFVCRQKVMALGSKVDADTATAKEKEELAQYNKEASSLENTANGAVEFPDTLWDDLHTRLGAIGAFNVDGESGGHVSEDIFLAKFQADSVLSHRRIHDFSDYILTSDSDIPSIVGAKGIIVKEIKIKKGRGKKGVDEIKEFIIQGGSNEGMEFLESLQLFGKNVVFHKANNPLLDYESPDIRMLVAAVLGNDFATCVGCSEKYGLEEPHRCAHHSNNIELDSPMPTLSQKTDEEEDAQAQSEIDTTTKALFSFLDTYEPDYYEVYCCIFAVNPKVLEYDFIGIKLIVDRSEKTREEKGEKDFTWRVNKYKELWASAFLDAMKRKRNMVNPRARTERSPSPARKPGASATENNNDNNTQRSSAPVKQRGGGHQGSWSSKCCYWGCNNTDLDRKRKGISLHNVQPSVSPNPPVTKDKRTIRSWYRKKEKRESMLRKCGVKDPKPDKEYHYCSAHTFVKGKKVKLVTINGKEEKLVMDTYLPDGKGVAWTEIKTISGGLASDRNVANIIKKLEKEKMTESLWKELIEVHQNLSPSKRQISQRIMDLLPGYIDEQAEARKPKKQVCKLRKKHTDKYVFDNNPVVTPGSRKDSEIKSKTGFVSEDLLLAFIAIINNGNLHHLTERNSRMTWYEEYNLAFEIMYGRTLKRLEDASREYKIYDVGTVYDSIILEILTCRFSWPTYASYEEDIKFRKDKWNEKYPGERVIMWDNTNVSFRFKPSTADNQRATHSKYYNENCCKTANGLMYCGWITAQPLWTGHISDSSYVKETGIFQEQDEFVMKDMVGGLKIPFKVILDRGYRLAEIAWQFGRQLLSQPIFSKADAKFTADDTVGSASVAADRSGNERGVNVCCRSDYIARGLGPSQSPVRLDNTWMSWAFQSNFMYKSVV